MLGRRAAEASRSSRLGLAAGGRWKSVRCPLYRVPAEKCEGGCACVTKSWNCCGSYVCEKVMSETYKKCSKPFGKCAIKEAIKRYEEDELGFKSCAKCLKEFSAVTLGKKGR